MDKPIEMSLWTYVVQDGKKEKSHFIPLYSDDKDGFLDGRSRVAGPSRLTEIDIQIRCPDPVKLMAIDHEGQAMFLRSGQIVDYRGRIGSASSLEIVSSSTFCFACRVNEIVRSELLDPRPAYIEMELGEEETPQVAAQRRISALAASMAASGMIDPEEIAKVEKHIADIDLDFFEDDDFDQGEYLEMEDAESTPISPPDSPDTAPVEEQGADAAPEENSPADELPDSPTEAEAETNA